MGEGIYSVEELEQILGVKPRTVHFWVQSGLLDGPGAGRGARYTDEHLAKLFMIQKLRAEGRPLAEIRAAVRRLPASDYDVLAEQARGEPRVEKLRAKELIGRWLSEGRSERQPAAAPSSARARQLSADRLQATTGAMPTGEDWRRVPLTSDVELHVRQPLSHTSRELVDALIAVARSLGKEH
jgi:DNA-binding transcriptional MerR regulator